MKKMNKKGFTIVELVIVIAVIAILAAVLIPTFSSVVNKANESSALQAVRNAFTECEVVLAGTGRELAEGTIFSDKDGKYFFKLTGNTIEKTSDKPKNENAYTTLENGVRLYGVSIECRATTASDGTNMSSNGYRVMMFAEPIKGARSFTLTVYDANGNVYYTETASKDESEAFANGCCFALWNVAQDATKTWDSNAKVSEIAQGYTKGEEAEGWYSYTLKVGDGAAVTGVFYYDGEER